MENLASKKIKSWRNRPWPKNWMLKLISFFFALFLWYFVVGEDKVDMSLSVPVEIVNLPADLTISNQFKRDLEITVTGPRGLMRNLSQQHISRPVDLSKAKPGPQIIKNTADSIPLPRGVRLMRVRPTDIILQLDKQIEKDIPIQSATTGTPPPGYYLGGIILEPASIRVNGPQGVVALENSISTEPIDLSRLTASSSITVALELSPAILDLVGEPFVTAHITLKEKMHEATIKNIPVHLIHIGKKSYTLAPEKVTVTAKIPFSQVKKTKDMTSLFTARIMAGNLPPGPHKLPVEIIPAQGIEVVEITPPKIDVVIMDAPEAAKEK